MIFLIAIVNPISNGVFAKAKGLPTQAAVLLHV